MPPGLQERISDMLKYLDTLPSNATGGLQKDLQKSYGEIRGPYMAAVLENLAKEAIEGSKTGGRSGGTDFTAVLEAFFDMAMVRTHIIHS